jgi:hypothetical protein
MALAGAISGGASLASAKMGSNAAKDAARIQSQSADKAAGMMNQAYAPYLQAGASSMGMLGRLTGAPAAARYASEPLPPAAGMPMQPRPQRPPMPQGPISTGMGPQGPVMMGGRPPMPGGPPMWQPGGMNQMGQMVRLVSPDGEERDVPAYLADSYISRGARRVG